MNLDHRNIAITGTFLKLSTQKTELIHHSKSEKGNHLNWIHTI